MNSRFSARFLYGTSPWNAAVLLLLLAFYAALSRWLFVAKVGSGARGVLLTGFVGLLLVGVILYYGSRQAAMSRLLDAETKHAESEKQMAYKLQGAFLQQGLPVASNLGFSATYLPATLGTLVGGDWYDAFELSRGRIMFSIGDVAGHGIEAAVTMSRARQAIIAAALQDSEPGSILVRANTALLLQDTKFATAICGYIDTATLEVTYATAGHPPGIMIDKDGSAQLLEYDGLPLGVAQNAVYPTFRLDAQRDSLLVLYTDGALEYDRDLLEGERRMLQTATDIAVRRVKDPAGAIQDAIFAEYEPLDDVAILAISFHDQAQDNGEQGDSERWSIGLQGTRAPFSEK
jgi:serine phosphatase RsbU (regulator of sigma subunit)